MRIWRNIERGGLLEGKGTREDSYLIMGWLVLGMMDSSTKLDSRG